MRKTNLYLVIALALALFASLTLSQVNVASAQTNEPVGVVVDYVPDRSITIMDQSGNEHEYLLAAAVKILPPGRANTLAVGSFVTIIAPASLSAGKETAVGIVVHPKIPDGWNVPSSSATPLATETAIGSETPTPVGTLPSETVTPVFSETPTAVETITVTETDTPTPTTALTDTLTPTPTDTTSSNNTFMEWLRSLFRQVLNNQ